jgi:hypothetical protein
VCVENGESIIALLNGDLDIESDDQMDLKSLEETPSEEELSEVMLESESESEESVLRFDGWEHVTGDNKLDAYTFTKNVRQQFKFLPVYFSMTSFCIILL